MHYTDSLIKYVVNTEFRIVVIVLDVIIIMNNHIVLGNI